ncbi:hypothetical protein SY27_07230 [Flavobacterium sp. 316]|uniref:Natural product n=1 Tax=Flavobacterium sediminilitoris TaxID=2024526 RepID=A0ABY4HMZ8_9FLAO|nr:MULTISPECIES: hypothetical protein [Flavobacterium]KIX21492.1 hypothetical protein SY27_07230 [Flavobacterium sp. 316]UOX34226.1 hypothetical protein LXD69_01625 [Flavobacterium sediminilitoris]
MENQTIKQFIMLKKNLKLEGVKELKKNELKKINGASPVDHCSRALQNADTGVYSCFGPYALVIYNGQGYCCPI